jgi:hypothetical protein
MKAKRNINILHTVSVPSHQLISVALRLATTMVTRPFCSTTIAELKLAPETTRIYKTSTYK